MEGYPGNQVETGRSVHFMGHTAPTTQNNLLETPRPLNSVCVDIRLHMRVLTFISPNSDTLYIYNY